jgi:NAD(P)-dependent dehydrogenase (short-subunit alcohol dehydrogenase family)
VQSSPVIVVLGAAGGMGSILARRLARQGARLVLAGRTPEPIAMLASELGAHGISVDATRFDQVDAMFGEAMELHGRVDGVANCVGSLLLKPAHLTSETDFAETVAANLTSAFAAVRAGARAMTKTGGSIVLVSSVAARVGLPNHDAIAAAKAGIIGLTLSAAATYARQRIRVNCVAPGLVRTPLTKRFTESEVALKASVNMHPLGRIGEPSDVASAMAWLLDAEQSWVTGQVIGIDGGLGSLRVAVTS